MISPTITTPAGDAVTAQESTDIAGIDRTLANKRRSAKACLSCRNRKVRCDVVISGGKPCTNCRLDSLRCIIKEPRRGRRPGPAKLAAQAAAAAEKAAAEAEKIAEGDDDVLAVEEAASTLVNVSSAATASSAVSVTPPRDIAMGDGSVVSQQANNNADECFTSLTFEDERLPPNPGDTHLSDTIGVFVQGLQEASLQAVDVVSAVDAVNAANAPRDRAASFASGATSAMSMSGIPSIRLMHESPQATRSPSTPFTGLPCYIRPLPSRIGARTIQYLSDEGALTIVEDAFRDELLRIYINIVYPFLPAMDFEEFLGPIVQPDGQRQVSLLLFQAVMFASVTFVDSSILEAQGFSSRKEARRVFFNRVRLLYSLECEPDRLALLQSLLLMTYWYDCPDDDKDTWYWMGVALSLAQVMGLHRDPAKLKIPDAEKHLKRRLWWSCVVRDRLLALGIRRPSRIREDEYDVPPLTIDDFDLRAPSPPIVRLLGASTLTAPDPSSRRVVAVMCTELARLCVCLGHILSSQYTVMGNHPIGSEYLLKAFVVAKISPQQAVDLVKCDASLREWKENQAAESKYTSHNQDPTSVNYKAERITRLHQALLHMVYLTAQTVLHRPQAVFGGGGGQPDAESIEASNASRKKITDAAIAITKLAFDLQSSKQMRYLSTSSVPAFISASLIHLLDSRSREEEVRNTSIGRFHQCIQALQELQDMYASADYGLRFLLMVLHNSDIHLPMFKSHLHASLLVHGANDDHSTSVGLTSDQPQVPLYQQMEHLQPEHIGTPAFSPSRISPRMETSYPSPSQSNAENYSTAGIDGQQSRMDGMQIVPPSQTSAGLFSVPWAPSHGTTMDMGEASMLQPTDILVTSPYLFNWTELGPFGPPAMRFDDPPSIGMSNPVEFM